MIPPRKPYTRKQRVSSLIQEEMGKLLLREVEFPGGIITIMGVDVTDKLDYARFHISVIPSSRGTEAVTMLNARQPYLQSLMMKKIQIRPTPTISFELDLGSEKAAGVEKALLDEETKNH